MVHAVDDRHGSVDPQNAEEDGAERRDRQESGLPAPPAPPETRGQDDRQEDPGDDGQRLFWLPGPDPVVKAGADDGAGDDPERHQREGPEEGDLTDAVAAFERGQPEEEAGGALALESPVQ